MSKYITRKEIADLLECSVDLVRKNEARFGLDGCRCPLAANFTRYFRASAIKALLLRGLIEPETEAK